ncbi:PREDICTED: disintegrin and metalloproteinase domain-containing protein 21-like [Eurypyga helias]|uniref:disintegrin and metalloproteinase domain-containing protein 21-like n=1 Tax=Eurypyga helias TaxID=54383 RepID=UPI0005281215|nr:PREDICTED: disintegrin and metalloproteinase domain-containing protein 21-like [Eurypyga helias]
MAPSWTRSRCSLVGRGLLLLGLGLPFLLPCTHCSPQPSWGYSTYEVVIPRKLGPKAGKASQDAVSYIISIQGVNYTIHLRPKDFVIKNLPVFTRDSQGEIVAQQPHVPADCYYHGYVEGLRDSAVTLTTCSGLRGLLQIGNSSYSIEPLAASTMAEHLLLQREETVPGTVMYKMPKEGERFPDSGRAAGQFRPRGHTRYLELLVVVDKEGFDTFGRSMTKVTLEVMEIINLVDGLFYSFHLRVLITALEVWVEKNLISVTPNITEVLHHFNLWREQRSLMRARHDVGCLFASMDFTHGTRALHVGGKSDFASACSSKPASAVVLFAKQPYVDTAVHLARALGHVLGMEHDDRFCRCGNTAKCIMSTQGTVNYQFSNCSKKNYLDFIASGQGFCLNNAPELVTPFALQHCGNGVLEDGEECDCGSEAQCKLDLCCDNTCQKRGGAICASGGCCKNCKLLPEGEVCRRSTDLCDLPEYCNGTSEHCPGDVAKQDGTVCAEDGYCYSGKCRSPTLQCVSIFGKEAKPAPLPCFQEVNTKGDRFGHCWGDGADINFQKCEPDSVLCGRVQCTNVGRLPQLDDHTTIIQTPVGDSWCWGTDYHLGADVLDPGAVKDGTRCGEKKICVNRTCVSQEKYLPSRCSAKRTCGGKGICNTRGNCHCDNGWAPPYCQFTGFGGSIDSGPAPVTKKGLLGFIIVTNVITAAVLALTALIIVQVSKLRVTRAVTRLIGCFGARERPPEEHAKDQAEEDGSKPAEDQSSPL